MLEALVRGGIGVKHIMPIVVTGKPLIVTGIVTDVSVPV
jgi:hypothetical protein